MTDRNIEYCRLRANGVLQNAAYAAAGFSTKTGSLNVTIRRKEEDPRIISKIAEFKRGIAKQELKGAKLRTQEQVEAIHKEVTAGGTRKLSKEQIEESLTALHDMSIATGDLGTARQCLVDLGREKGMFTPVQKVRFETAADLNLEDTETLMKKLMAAHAAEQQAIPVEEESAGTEPVVQ